MSLGRGRSSAACTLCRIRDAGRRQAVWSDREHVRRLWSRRVVDRSTTDCGLGSRFPAFRASTPQPTPYLLLCAPSSQNRAHLTHSLLLSNAIKIITSRTSSGKSPSGNPLADEYTLGPIWNVTEDEVPWTAFVIPSAGPPTSAGSASRGRGRGAYRRLLWRLV
jgi:hypothetical protein